MCSRTTLKPSKDKYLALFLSNFSLISLYLGLCVQIDHARSRLRQIYYNEVWNGSLDDTYDNIYVRVRSYAYICKINIFALLFRIYNEYEYKYDIMICTYSLADW